LEAKKTVSVKKYLNQTRNKHFQIIYHNGNTVKKLRISCRVPFHDELSQSETRPTSMKKMCQNENTYGAPPSKGAFLGYKTSHNERTCKLSHMCEFIDVFAAALLEKMTLTTANN